MTTQTALTVVGYAVGSYFGYPQLGAMVGAAVGYALTPDPADQHGPRMDDRRVQVSTYGVSIPLAYGAVRMAGNVIWAKDLEEVATENEVGGKGGPSQTQVTYTYYATFATLLCKGPMRGIRRIWADAVLIYDGRINNPAGFAVEFTWYPGTEDQLPDPTIEAALGVGNVPAYRGFAYLVFNRLPLERFGNRIPSLTIEALGEGGWQFTEEEIGPASAVIYQDAIQRMDGQVIALSEPTAGTTRLSMIDPATGTVVFSTDTALNPSGRLCYVPPLDEVWVSSTGPVALERYSATTLAHVARVELDASGWNGVTAAYEPAQRYVAAHRSTSQVGSGTSIPITLNGQYAVTRAGMFYADRIITGGSQVYLGTGGLHQFGVFGTDFYILLTTQNTTSSGNVGVWDVLHQRYVVSSSQGLWTVSDNNPPTIELHEIDGWFGSSAPQEIQYIPALNAYAVYSSVVGIIICSVIDAETFELIEETTNASTNGVTSVFLAPDRPGTAFVLGNYQPYNLTLFSTTLDAVVTDLCTESGLAPSDISVGELALPIRGYLVSQFGPARGALEQLANAFLFECTEQDDILYFRRRGGATVATLTADDCGAGVDSAAPFPIAKTRGQEADLPAKLYVTAPDPYTDHQPGTQYSERQTAHAGADEQVQFAVVLSVTENRRLADALLFDRWASRSRRSWATTRKFARLVPSDPIVLNSERVRILSRSDEGSVIRWEGITDDADVVVQLSSGVQGTFPGQAVTVNVPTTMLLLDMALLRDADDGPGAYGAAYGPAPYWRGAVLYTSADGIAWERIATLPRPGSSIGVATNALGSWAGGNVFDESNQLNVTLYNGSAESTTRLGVLSGSNALAIAGPDGWEILQYRDALLEDDGTYTLTGLLRGRRGTGYAMSGHAAGDRVVLLVSATIRDLRIESSVIGVERTYRAVSIGDTLSNTPDTPATINAERLKPWAPVDLRAARDIATGDITLTWKRRTRLACRFTGTGGINVPLGEDSEAYVVQVMDSGSFATVIRTINVTGPATAAYSAADQTTDFGSPQSTVYVRITQTSATVGAGHELEAAA